MLAQNAQLERNEKMMMLRGWILGALFAAATGVAAQGMVSAQSDRDFLAAREAQRVDDIQKLDRLAPLLDRHPLAPYARYWQLLPRLDDMDPDTVRRFLSTYADTPLAARMRNQ